MGQLPLFLKEVLPIVADIATVTSFVVLILIKLLTIPLFFEWLTLLKYMSRIIRGFFICIPSVSNIRMYPCMTLFTKSNQVISIMCSSFGER